MNTQMINITNELTLEQLDEVNGGWSLNPFDILVVIADAYYDSVEAGENRRARQRYTARTGETNGKM